MRSAVLGAVLLLALVSGCSAGDAEPAEVEPLVSGSATEGTPKARTSASAAPVPSLRPIPGQAQPPLPAAATAGDAAGAAAFARHYMATLEQAVATGDSVALEKLSDPRCGGCRNLLEAIGDAVAVGHKVQGAELNVAFAEAPAVRAGETIVDLRYERRAGSVVDTNGVVVKSIAPEGPVDTQLRVQRTGTGWLVLGFRRVGT